MSESITALRARVAARKRHHPDASETVEAERDLKAAVLAQHVQRAVSEAPRLTPEQLDRIGAILRGGVSRG